MAETDYATVGDLAGYLELRGDQHDGPLSTAIESASRVIEDHCDRRTFLLDTVDTVRVYASRRPNILYIDDVVDDSNLVVKVSPTLDGVFGTTWTEGTEFEVYPLNATVNGLPISELRTIAGSRFPTAGGSRPVVEVTGRHGFPAVPRQVKQATLILASRLFRRSLSPEGIVQGFDTPVRVGVRLDPDVETLLAPLRLNPMKV